MIRRRALEAAATACALAVLLVPVHSTAYAAPTPPPGGERAADDDPARRARLEQVRKEIERLHDEAGSAIEAYHAAAEKVRRHEKEHGELTRRIDNNQGRLESLNKQAGAMARAQYRGVGLPVSNRLVLERDPERFLHSVSLLRKGQQATKGVIAGLGSTQQALRGSAEKADALWEKLEASRKKRAAARKRTEDRIATAERLESQLRGDDLALLLELEGDAAHRRQLEWLRSGVLDEIDSKASAEGRTALAFALRQLGKDYRWGATGPATYDCSGLTLRAWEAAGIRIPRTSQQQWRRLERVALTDMRPGDLIIYKGDASHVGMYVGRGEMVHSPRTGRQIRIEGVGTLPIKGVVRPDAR